MCTRAWWSIARWEMFMLLMRVVGLDEKACTEIVHREYKNAHYLHLRSNIISSIEIKLANGLGEEIKFKQGNSILVLHFRKRKSS